MFIYAAVLAAAVFVLQWLEYQYVSKVFATEIYIVLLVVGFLAFGIWLGRQLTPRSHPSEFKRNEVAIKSLGITRREHAVLSELAKGQSNKQIADALHVSANTVKTHISNLYEKLDVGQRLHAVQKARDLRIIP